VRIMNVVSLFWFEYCGFVDLASDSTIFARFFRPRLRGGSEAHISIETALTRFSTFTKRLYGEAVSG